LKDYGIYIQQKSLTAQKPLYKKLMIEGSNCKKTFAEALASFGSQEKVETFLVYYYETLKQPLLPLANLKRETILCSAQTIFQNKLSEVLYEDSGMVVMKSNFPSESEDFINELYNFEEKILKEASFCNKENICKARWYALDQKFSESLDESPKLVKPNLTKSFPNYFIPSKSLDSTNDEVQSIKNNSVCLLDIYNSICSTISHFCGVISYYLNSLDNIYDLMAEYTSRWNAYVCTMLELEQTFKAFTELMNKTYEHIFQGHPCFPKFSMWRLLTKIWMREVYEKSNLNFSLNESFLRILGNHREKNVKDCLNASFSNLNFEECKSGELPKCLYVNLKTKNKKKSTLQYQNAHQLQNIVPGCFEPNSEVEKKLLSCFLQSVLDLSLNEVSIHYLDCTEINTNYPYQEIEEAFLIKSDEFYNDYQQLFTESPDYFCHFLKADCSLISEILPQRTNIKLEKILIQTGLRFSKEFVNNQFDCLKQDQLESCDTGNTISSEQADGIGMFIEEFLTEALEEHTRGPTPCSNFYNLPPIEIEDDCDEMCEEKEDPVYCKYADSKAFIKKLTNFLYINYPNFKGNFEYLQQRLQEFENIKQNDKYIKETNVGKNIPCEMGDVDRLFYDLDKNVDIFLLQKLSEDYNAFLNNSEDKENSRGLDSPSLEEVMGPNGNANNNVNGFDDFILEPNFVDFANIDLLSLDNPSLRRAPF